MFQFLKLAGTPIELGRQHGRQILHLRPTLVRVMAARLAELLRLGADAPAVVEPAHAALVASDRPLLEYLAGLGEALSLPFVDLLTYTLSSYLRDLHRVAPPSAAPAFLEQSEWEPGDGCTVWAAAAPYTAGATPILAKNRDYHTDHIPLQHIAEVHPAHGYRYLAVGSAGSPLVFSSGINERGLAIADTHVLSADIGPGLPRFSLMRAVLEEHATTQSALDYLRSVPHMGAGTLTLADAHGHLAVCESGNRVCGYVEANGDGKSDAFVASTNHFATPELASQWVEDEPPHLQGNSPARRGRVLAALAAGQGQVDVAWAQALMSTHGTPLDALCRHTTQTSTPACDTDTISSVILLPRGQAGAPAVYLAEGHPCCATWESRQVGH